MKFLFRFFNVILILILFAIFIGAGLGYLQIYSSAPRGKDVTIYIKPGSSTSDISNLLASEGIVKSSFIFKFLANYTNVSSKLQAGEHTLNTSMSMFDVMKILQECGIDKSATFTIPEGYDARQIGNVLEEKNIVTKKEFLEIVEKGLPGDIEFKYAKILKNHSLEGFLFPDTYEYSKSTTVKQIIRMMLARFQELVPEDFEKLARKRGLSPYELIILASMVEREARLEKERPVIAAVYYNRLKRDMLMECDATIQYLFDKPKEFLLYSDLEIKSPYNTYLNKGLPPGPIANPGISSIKAALYPAKADYLYYVATGDGGHKFNTSYEEHLKAVEEYRQKMDNK